MSRALDRIRSHPRLAHRAVELRAIGHHARQVGILAVVTGASTGLAVAAFDRVVGVEVFGALLRAPLWVQAVAPAAGLALAALALRWIARGASPATADEYVRNFHDPDHSLALRPVPGRLAAGAATLGGGAAMGFEGPAVYIGAALGAGLQRLFTRFFSRVDGKVLMVCGAAAGVAAIFKAPATGLVFALEVPYRQDLARRMLLPAMFASASSYVVYAAINGTAPLFPIAGAPPFDLRDLGGAALIGLLCGAGARVFSAGLALAKRKTSGIPARWRVPAAGALIAAVFALGRLLTGQSLVIGSGYEAIHWALEPDHAIAVTLGLFVLRAAATALAVVGGGAGGLFVPLVVQGAVLGSAFSAAVGAPDTSLFPLLGVAAFLGAGYRVPLAAVVFVAESTGRPGFVVPGLIAAASSQLLMGRASVSSHQQDARTGVLERRLALPVSAALRTDAATASPESTIEAVFEHHIAELRMRIVPVVDGDLFRGMVTLHDLARCSRDEWTTCTAADLMRADWPVGDLRWTLREAVAVMERHDVDRLPIVDGGRFAGLVTTGEILKLDAILDTTEQEGLPGRSPARTSRRTVA